jgi:hypothetical protein
MIIKIFLVSLAIVVVTIVCYGRVHQGLNSPLQVIYGAILGMLFLFLFFIHENDVKEFYKYIIRLSNVSSFSAEKIKYLTFMIIIYLIMAAIYVVRFYYNK